MKNGKFKSNWLWLLTIFALALGYFLFLNEKVSEQLPVAPTPTTENVKGIATEAVTSTIPPSKGDWYEVYFTSPQIPFDKKYEGGIEKYLINKIDSAQTSIDIAVYEFDIESVAQALIKAKERGVEIRVVYDNEYSDPDPQIGELKSAGIKAIPDNRSSFMHNKFFVFDNQCIWTGSFNISLNAAYRNNENALHFCSPEVAKNYSTEFSEMFNGKFGSTSPSDTPYPTFTIEGVLIENYFASEDDVMDKVISTVDQAKSSIHFMTYSFTDDNLGKTMINRSNNGVLVEGIFETVGANSSYTDPETEVKRWLSECKALLNSGLDVRLDGNPRTFHHKVIIVDGQTVILGSFNFSSNANTQNDENLLIVHDPRLAGDYEQQYQLMKQQAVIPTGDTCTK